MNVFIPIFLYPGLSVFSLLLISSDKYLALILTSSPSNVIQCDFPLYYLFLQCSHITFTFTYVTMSVKEFGLYTMVAKSQLYVLQC